MAEAEAEAQAWWADVEHLRERIERRRSAQQGTLHSNPASTVISPGAVPGARRSEAAERRGEHSPRDGAGPQGFVPRRTVRIRGQAIPTVHAPQLRPAQDLATPEREVPSASERRAERASTRPGPARQRLPRRATDRVGEHPDRLALWAVLLGVLLALVAVASAHGAVPRIHARGAPIVRPHVRSGAGTRVAGPESAAAVAAATGPSGPG